MLNRAGHFRPLLGDQPTIGLVMAIDAINHFTRIFAIVTICLAHLLHTKPDFFRGKLLTTNAS